MKSGSFRAHRALFTTNKNKQERLSDHITVTATPPPPHHTSSPNTTKTQHHIISKKHLCRTLAVQSLPDTAAQYKLNLGFSELIKEEKISTPLQHESHFREMIGEVESKI